MEPDPLKAAFSLMAHRIVAMRRDLHAHPELAYEEVRISGIIARHLRTLGLEVQTGVAKTGVVGVLRGGARKQGVVYADADVY